jgi:hypothetical protein
MDEVETEIEGGVFCGEEGRGVGRTEVWRSGSMECIVYTGLRFVEMDTSCSGFCLPTSLQVTGTTPFMALQ